MIEPYANPTRRPSPRSVLVVERGSTSPPRDAWVLDLPERRLVSTADVIALTALDCALLARMVRMPHQPLPYAELRATAQAAGHRLDEGAIDREVARLRGMLDRDLRMPSLIRTMAGVGYLYVPSPPLDPVDA